MVYVFYVVILYINYGDIVINFFGDYVLKMVKNFVGFVDGIQEWIDFVMGKFGEGFFYKDVIFYCIILNFMIQGGDLFGQGVGGFGYNFDDEINMEFDFNKLYIFVMVNVGFCCNVIMGKFEGINGLQFFIIIDLMLWLQGKYMIFGEVVDDVFKVVVDVIGVVEMGFGDCLVELVVLQLIDIVVV